MPKQTFFRLPEEKRARILDATIEEFSSRAYEKTSVNRVIALSGIPSGSFYQYFENKDDLYLYCLTEMYRPLVGKQFSRSLDYLLQSFTQNPETVAYQEKIARELGERNYRFLCSIYQAPNSIRRQFLIEFGGNLLYPSLVEKMAADHPDSLAGPCRDFGAFLLGMCNLMLHEYKSLRQFSDAELGEYTAMYMNIIVEGCKVISRQTEDRKGPGAGGEEGAV